MRHPDTEISYSEIEYMFKINLNIKLGYTVTYLVDVINRILKDAEIVKTINPKKICKCISSRDYTIITNALFLIADLTDKSVDEVKQIILTNLNINLDHLIIYKK